MKIVTFNLRCAWDGDGINSFPHRAGSILNKIKKESPEVICFQEGIEKNVAFLRNALPEYHIVFNQRNNDYRGEGIATALKKDSVELLGLDSFWLSPTPQIPGTRFEEQSVCPRICQCILLRHANGKMFRVYNTHLDHKGEQARVLGIQAVLQRMQADLGILDVPFFLMGDFNATPDEETIRICSESTSPVVKELTEPITLTFHNYGRITENYKIDYIYADAATAQLPIAVAPWDDATDGIYLSDHYPLQIELSF